MFACPQSEQIIELCSFGNSLGKVSFLPWLFAGIKSTQCIPIVSANLPRGHVVSWFPPGCFCFRGQVCQFSHFPQFLVLRSLSCWQVDVSHPPSEVTLPVPAIQCVPSPALKAHRRVFRCILRQISYNRVDVSSWRNVMQRHYNSCPSLPVFDSRSYPRDERALWWDQLAHTLHAQRLGFLISRRPISRGCAI